MLIRKVHASFVKDALHDDAEILRRIAIYTITERFERLREIFEEAISPDLFISGLRHELYRLLNKRFSALSAAGKAAIIAAIREIPQPNRGEDQERRLKFTQREWLSAIKDQPEASAWFAELSTDPALGSPTERPEFLAYHETRWGPGPTPYATETLVAFARDGTLMDRLAEFKETDPWKGPTLGGLVAALEGAAAAMPNAFLPLLSSFHDAKLPFQHAMLSGFKRLLAPSNEPKPELDWKSAWPRLINYFTECISDPTFWAHVPEENVNLTPTRGWMVSLIADFLEAGTKDDETAYAPELLSRGWAIITTLLGRAPDEAASLTDPMMHALNTEKGRVVSAMFSHALRVCRLAKMDNRPIAEAWATVEGAFDSELAKCRNSNFEFSTIAASYLANVDFMSHEWLVANARDIFAINYPTNFKAALGGLAYATPTRPIYQLLAQHGILEAALKTKLEDRYGRERIVEWISLAFLWGDETLETPQFEQLFAGGPDDLQHATEFFWQVQGEKLTDEQVGRVLAFWKKSIGWSRAQKRAPAVLLSALSRLSPYLKNS